MFLWLFWFCLFVMFWFDCVCGCGVSVGVLGMLEFDGLGCCDCFLFWW